VTGDSSGCAVEARDGLRRTRIAHLILMLGFGDLYSLLEDAVLLLKLDCLLPVIEIAGDENVLGVVWPSTSE
jgi:hypothetical protein